MQLRHVNEPFIFTSTPSIIHFSHLILDIGLPSGKSLFQLQAERILCVQRLASQSINEGEFVFCFPCNFKSAGRKMLILMTSVGSHSTPHIHWYIMTSPFTDEATRKYFESHKYFGLESDQVSFFGSGLFDLFEML